MLCRFLRHSPNEEASTELGALSGEGVRLEHASSAAGAKSAAGAAMKSVRRVIAMRVPCIAFRGAGVQRSNNTLVVRDAQPT